MLTELIGESPGIVAVRAQVRQLLQRHSASRRLPPLLFLGETGTGKGLLARAVHRAGPRASGPFVGVNCAAIPETLLEAELFGYERGAFTDARQSKAGLFQAAQGGTLFLDEVGLLPEALQAKLLTVLEDRTVRRLGSTRSEPVDVWVVAAASDDLERAIHAGRFREELYHRLAVVTLRLPPLRQRGEDILTLAEQFLARSCAEYRLPVRGLSEDARTALLAYRWPGNVRELSNVMERVALLTEAPVVTAALLGLPGAEAARTAPSAPPPGVAGEPDGDEQARILAALRETGWNVTRTAARLGLTRNALRYRMQKYALRSDGRRAEPAALVRSAVAPAAPSPGGGAPAEARPPAALRWERRHVAVLLVGLSPAAAGEPGGGIETVVEKVRAFGGRVEELSPARVVATFGIEPTDDAPAHAAHAALAIRAAAERGGAGVSGPGAPRLALDVSHATVARAGDFAGVDEAARREARDRLEALLGVAVPGEVLLGEATVPFLERRFSLEPLGRPAAGAGRACRLGGLDRTGLGLGAGLAPFEGREAELAALERCYRAARVGALQVVHVAGEPGIGKSRLVHEFRQRLAPAGTIALQGRCVADGGATPFLPFVEAIGSAFLAGSAESPGATAALIRRGLERLGLPVETNLPFLALLLGLETETGAAATLGPEIIGVRTREVLIAVLRARCQLGPVVLILDDLHWVDPASRDFLAGMIGESPELPLTVVAAFRPPYRPPWAEAPAVREVRLGPLPPESCHRLIRRLPGSEILSSELVQRVVERADGNPLYAEELARYLIRGAKGTHGTAAPSPAALDVSTLPGTLQQLLVAHLDRLPGEAQAVLEAVSVLGRSISAPLLEAVAAVEGRGVAFLRDFEAQDLLAREDGPAREAAGERYRFRHVLIQEAVYERLPAARRAALHGAAAAAIERLHGPALGEWAEVLAQHHEQTDRRDRAAAYHLAAGEKSLRLCSLDEAAEHFGRVLALAESSPGAVEPKLVADGVLGLLEVHHYRGDREVLCQAAEAHRPLVEAAQDGGRLARLLFWAGRGHLVAGRVSLARRLLEEGRALAEAAGDERSVGYASAGLMTVHFVSLGFEPRETIEALAQRVRAAAERTGDAYLASQGLDSLSVTLKMWGRYPGARRAAEELITLGRTAGAPPFVLEGMRDLAWLEIYEERYDEAIEHAEEALRLAPTPLARLSARAVRGAALAFAGDPVEALSDLPEVRAEHFVARIGVDLPYGVALVRAGRVAEGIRWIEETIRRFAALGNIGVAARGEMLLGEIYLGKFPAPQKPGLTGRLANLAGGLGRGSDRRAGAHLEVAIQTARRIDLPGILARCLLDISQLRARQDRLDEARGALEEALRVAEPLESPVLLEGIRAALRDLPASTLDRAG